MLKRSVSNTFFRSVCFCLLAAIALCVSSSVIGPANHVAAQEDEVLDDSLDEGTSSKSASGGASDPAGGSQSFGDAIKGMGVLGILFLVLFFLMSLLMVFLIVEHSLTMRKGKLMPEFLVAELEQKIARAEINEAIEYCHQPENYSLASEIILAGLERYQGSEFGFAEYKTAVEEEGEEQTARLYRKTEVLGVIGAVAPMLGLTGTVLGMIMAFNKIAASGGAAKPEELAGGIGTALVTTLLGLLVAIPSMIAFSYFRNKIDSLVAEIGKRVERVMMPMGRKR